MKLAAAGLRLKPSKCKFFKSKVNYLGHIVSKKGIETDPKKIEAIEKWPVPKMVTEVRSFLGFTNYYHKFIPRYAQVAKPLNQLVSGDNANKKKIFWLTGLASVKMLLNILNAYVVRHQFWHMQTTQNHSSYIQTLVNVDWEQCSIKNKLMAQKVS